ncbi:class II aldolase/adducin family protein [Alkalibaculum sp. M08DMB]|uniref:Class II aldolase/adducin family protein n=1 Tax=Alkalibaculum sporogenes TaxID=2655001 RepID=A0A6A7K9K9_9FIRM|nr:class II aldolase/adducin family protein [Alkalibaculum sporogenes]MPW26140.1 class II aldolase/adducin family protein [Alkalibaculum sporogenes]
MFEKEKLEIIKAGINLDKYGLIALSGGNLSSRMPSGEILVTPSGMIYDDMVPDDILVMDLEGNIIEGIRKPSSDTEAILYVFEKREDLNAVIHTHQPYATAIGLVCDEFKVNLTTLANSAAGNVKVSPYSSPGSIEMGIDTVNYLGDSLAVILAHHGVMTVGTSMKQALYAAIYMEEAAKCYISARSIGDMKEMTEAQVDQAIEIFKYYGQGNGTIPKELLKKV